jgi:hypothetical protein
MIAARVSFILLLSCVWTGAAIAYDAAPKRPVSLEGRWVLNTAQSDDAEKMLMETLEKQRARDRKLMERYQRARRAAGEPVLPPLGEDDVDMPAATRDARARMMRRRDREEALYRRMLAISPSLRIQQDGSQIDIESTVESRRFDAGSRSQVSMPEGQLADSEVGWKGEWFIIDRKARGGPSVVEKFRLIRKTDQLEYQMDWRGDTELAGLEVRRIYDRAVGAPPVRNPDLGPVR